MVEYYVTIGNIKEKSENGDKIYYVVNNGKEHYLSIYETIMWCTLHWNILTEKELESDFGRALHKQRIFDDVSFKQVLCRLMQRGLIQKGTNYIAADAVYSLAQDLLLKPIGFVNSFKRLMAFLCLYVQGTPLEACVRYLRKPALTELEQKIMRFSKRFKVSTAELIKIAEGNLWNVQTEEELVEKVYGRELYADTIGNSACFDGVKYEILTAVVSLYLKKQAVFEH